MVNEATNQVQPPAEAAGAPQTATPSTPAAPENIALRYRYNQLDSKHKAMADRITALMIAYPDIVKLHDPKQQQDFLDRLARSDAGKTIEALQNELGDKGKEAASFLRKANIPLLSSAVGAASATDEAVEGAAGLVGAARQGMRIAASPFNASAAGISEFFNQAKVLANGMTPEQAQAVGAAYASVLQVREEERANAGLGAAVSSFDNAWSYTKATFSWLWDMARELPLVGELLKKLDNSPTYSFAEHLNRQFVQADVAKVQETFARAETIAGVDTKAWGAALTQEGSALQNRAGQDVNLNAPGKDNGPLPSAANAPTDANGNPIAAAPSAAGVLADAANQSGNAASAVVKNSLSGLDTTPKQIAAVAGAAAAVDAAKGFAEGTVRQFVGEKSGPVRRATALADEANGLAKKAEDAKAGKSGLRFWESDTAREARANKLDTQAAGLREEALKHASVADSRAELTNGTKIGKFAEGAVEEKPGLLRVGNKIGRFAGDVFGKLTEGASNKAIEVGEYVLEKIPALAKFAPKLASKAIPGAAVLGAGVTITSFAHAAATDDTRGMVTSGTELGTVGAGAAAGAAVGVWFGGVGAIPGAVAGAAIGGLASLVTGEAAGYVYDKSHEGDAGLAAAAVSATRRAEDARVKAAKEGGTLVMAGARSSTGCGSIVTQAGAQPVCAPQRPQAQQPALTVS